MKKTRKDTQTIPEAVDYHEAGFRVFELHDIVDGHKCACGDPDCDAVGKHPGITQWQNIPRWDDEQFQTMQKYQIGTGFGVLCAGWLVVDVDPRNGGSESFARLQKDLGLDLVEESGFVVRTGGDGLHVYFRLPEGTYKGSLHNYKGVDFKCSGFVVGAGSLHLSGNRYEYLKGNPYEVGNAPDSLVELLRRQQTVSPSGEGGNVSPMTLAQTVATLPNDSVNYDDWLRVGMAIHHASGGSNDGYALWVGWSAKSAKHEPEQMLKKWQSFGDHDHAVRFSTLVWMKEQATATVTQTTLSDYLVDLEAAEIETQWIVPGYLPAGEVCLLSGHGSSGKTTLALQWAVALAAGVPFLNCGRRGRVLVWNAEDRARTTRRRIRKYCKHHGINIADLAVDVLDVSGGRGVLWTEARVEGVTIGKRTAALNALEQFVREQNNIGRGYSLILIDNISDVFAANENDRQAVRGFVSTLGAIAEENALAVVLIGHLQKAAIGKANAEQYSGSTAWNNSVRSRLSLERDADGYARLTHHKSNLGPLQPVVQLVQDGELFRIDNAKARAEDTATQDDAAVLAAVTAAHAIGERIPTGKTGASSAWSFLCGFEELPAALRQREHRERVYLALNRLVKKGALIRESYRNEYRNVRHCYIPQVR